MVRYLLLAAVLVGCGADDFGQSVDAGGFNDATSSCHGGITFDPDQPEASDLAPIRATVNLQNAFGVLTYQWSVLHDSVPVTVQQEASDNSQVSFFAPDPGVYDVIVQTDAPYDCTYLNTSLTVAAAGANNKIFRLRAVPPSGVDVPPQEQVIQVKGGGDIARDIQLESGLNPDGIVHSGSLAGPPVAAYLKFIPISAPLAFTELFTGASGQYSTHLLGVTHDVLVIPSDSSLAPTKLQWTPGGAEDFVVTGGTVVSGTVVNPAGTPLAGATVQLTSNGVPSTIGITQANGSFNLRADYPAGSQITVKVTPLSTSGLPRLEATGAFTLAQPLQIAYSSSLAVCDLANTSVKRSAVAQAGAKVTVVGTLAANGGTVTFGAAANAVGTVRVAATTDATGKLPSLRVPRAANLVAVSQLGPSDFALDSLDTSTCSGLAIDAPPLDPAAGVAKDALTNPLGGVRVQATPTGPLAIAGAPPIEATTAANGAFSLSLAATGHYDVRFVDPLARAARLELLDVTSSGVPATATLPAALRMSGGVYVSGSVQSLSGTAVQLLCAQCSGVDATRPVAESAADGFGNYQLAVPDPGTM